MQANNVRRYIAYEGTVDYIVRSFVRRHDGMDTNERTNRKINYLFGIADLTRLQLPKCNNHLVSFIKVDGLSVSYIVIIFTTITSERWSIVLWIVNIFDIIKSRMMVWRYI